jgi:hypothetical protein
MEDIQNFISALARRLNEIGIHVRLNRPPILVKGPKDSIADAYEKTCNAAYNECANVLGANKARGPQLVIVIMEKKSKEYQEIKKASDSNCGVPSQCVLVKNLWGAFSFFFSLLVGFAFENLGTFFPFESLL